MRVISNTRWTVSEPRTSSRSRPAPLEPAGRERDHAQPAGVEEREPAEVEHDPPHVVVRGQPADLLVEGRGAGQVELSGKRDQRVAGARERRFEGEGGHLDREA